MVCECREVTTPTEDGGRSVFRAAKDPPHPVLLLWKVPCMTKAHEGPPRVTRCPIRFRPCAGGSSSGRGSNISTLCRRPASRFSRLAGRGQYRSRFRQPHPVCEWKPGYRRTHLSFQRRLFSPGDGRLFPAPTLPAPFLSPDPERPHIQTPRGSVYE